MSAPARRAQCHHCPWRGQLWLTERRAQHEAVWHVYEAHPEVWLSTVGDRPPTDPDPRRLN